MTPVSTDPAQPAAEPTDPAPDAGHLGYYLKRGISPVRYDIGDLVAHFNRRDALYRTLGLPPIAFKGCSVLEVAPGSGHNSIYVATTMPARYDLVEPNPTARADIGSLYAQLTLAHTAPELHAVRFEEFDPGWQYDIVLCENWLGSAPSERVLIRKLADLVAPGGVMVLTLVPPLGFLPNILRKLMARRLLAADLSFDEQTARLVEVFGSHLATIAHMTRSHADWVQDCMLNPHYLNVALPLGVVLAEIGDCMEALSSSPVFGADWRWFKAITGPDRGFNDRLAENHLANLHNFIDYRRTFPPRSAAENEPLEKLSAALLDAARRTAGPDGHADASGADPMLGVLSALDGLSGHLAILDPSIARGLEEARAVLAAPNFGPEAIKKMRHFGGLFGRETIYVSFTKKQTGKRAGDSRTRKRTRHP